MFGISDNIKNYINTKLLKAQFIESHFIDKKLG